MKSLKLSTLFALLFVSLFAFTACDDDDLDDRSAELRLDGEHFTEPLLDAGLHRFAVRFTEADLREFDGRELVGIRVYIGRPPAALELRAFDDGDVVPVNELDFIRAATPIPSGGFFDYEFARPLIINADNPLWLEAEVELTERQQSIGCDRGPAQFGGDWLWSEDSFIPFSERTPESVNWNIRGIVR